MADWGVMPKITSRVERWTEDHELQADDLLMTDQQRADGHPKIGDYVALDAGDRYEWYLVTACE